MGHSRWKVKRESEVTSVVGHYTGSKAGTQKRRRRRRRSLTKRDPAFVMDDDSRRFINMQHTCVVCTRGEKKKRPINIYTIRSLSWFYRILLTMRSGEKRDDDSLQRLYNVNREEEGRGGGKVMILDPLNPFHVIANIRERIYLCARETHHLI